MIDTYRFKIQYPLTAELLLRAAIRLAEADREGHDLSRAVIQGQYILVSVRRTQRPVQPVKEGPNRFEVADQYRNQIVEWLRRNGPATAAQIARAVHLTQGQRGHLLGTLLRMGRLELEDGKYRIREVNAS